MASISDLPPGWEGPVSIRPACSGCHAPLAALPRHAQRSLSCADEALCRLSSSLPSAVGTTAVAVVCSGHGADGAAAAARAAESLLATLSAGSGASQLDAAACEAAFMAAHQSLLQPAAGAACALDASTSGASALVLCVEPACPSAPSTSSRLLVASAGACSAVLGRLGPGGGLQAVQLDGDARLSAPLERCRLEGSAPGVRVEADPAAPGGWVLVVDGQGPLPGVSAARMLGASSAEQYGVTPQPLLTQWAGSEADAFVLAGTPGLWAALSAEAAVEFVGAYLASGLQAQNGLSAADALTLEAQERLRARARSSTMSSGVGEFAAQPMLDVCVVALPLAAAARLAAGGDGSDTTGLQQSYGVAGLCTAAAHAAQPGARSQAEAAAVAAACAEKPAGSCSCGPACAPFPELLPRLRSYPWGSAGLRRSTSNCSSQGGSAGNVWRRSGEHRPARRRSSSSSFGGSGQAFSLSRRHSFELEKCTGSWGTASSAEAGNKSPDEEEPRHMVVHKVYLSGPLEMESLLYGCPTSQQADTTVARHLPMRRSQSLGVPLAGTHIFTAARSVPHAQGLSASDGGGTYGNGSSAPLQCAKSVPMRVNKARSYQALAALVAAGSAGDAAGRGYWMAAAAAAAPGAESAAANGRSLDSPQSSSASGPASLSSLAAAAAAAAGADASPWAAARHAARPEGRQHGSNGSLVRLTSLQLFEELSASGACSISSSQGPGFDCSDSVGGSDAAAACAEQPPHSKLAAAAAAGTDVHPSSAAADHSAHLQHLESLFGRCMAQHVQAEHAKAAARATDAAGAGVEPSVDSFFCSSAASSRSSSDQDPHAAPAQRLSHEGALASSSGGGRLAAVSEAMGAQQQHSKKGHPEPCVHGGQRKGLYRPSSLQHLPSALKTSSKPASSSSAGTTAPISTALHCTDGVPQLPRGSTPRAAAAVTFAAMASSRSLPFLPTASAPAPLTSLQATLEEEAGSCGMHVSSNSMEAALSMERTQGARRRQVYASASMSHISITGQGSSGSLGAQMERTGSLPMDAPSGGLLQRSGSTAFCALPDASLDWEGRMRGGRTSSGCLLSPQPPSGDLSCASSYSSLHSGSAHQQQLPAAFAASPPAAAAALPPAGPYFPGGGNALRIQRPPGGGWKSAFDGGASQPVAAAPQQQPQQVRQLQLPPSLQLQLQALANRPSTWSEDRLSSALAAGGEPGELPTSLPASPSGAGGRARVVRVQFDTPAQLLREELRSSRPAGAAASNARSELPQALMLHMTHVRTPAQAMHQLPVLPEDPGACAGSPSFAGSPPRAHHRSLSPDSLTAAEVSRSGSDIDTDEGTALHSSAASHGSELSAASMGGSSGGGSSSYRRLPCRAKNISFEFSRPAGAPGAQEGMHALGSSPQLFSPRIPTPSQPIPSRMQPQGSAEGGGAEEGAAVAAALLGSEEGHVAGGGALAAALQLEVSS